MSTWNPELSAIHEVRREAEEAGVLEPYLAEARWAEHRGMRSLSVQERRELVKKLVAERRSQ